MYRAVIKKIWKNFAKNPASSIGNKQLLQWRAANDFVLMPNVINLLEAQFSIENEVIGVLNTETC